MTELEKRLSKSLLMQESVYKTELEKISTQHKEESKSVFIEYESQMKTVLEVLERQEMKHNQEMKSIVSNYESQMSKALQVLERQAEQLSEYEKVSTNWQISINEEQLQKLQTSLHQEFESYQEDISEEVRLLRKSEDDILMEISAQKEEVSELNESLENYADQLNKLLKSLKNA